MAEVVRPASDVRLVHGPPDDAEEFGLRVNWQSESERIEAAEFLIATRLQEDVRRRVAAEMEVVREQSRVESAAEPRVASSDEPGTSAPAPG
jgi:hypothetical protein